MCGLLNSGVVKHSCCTPNSAFSDLSSRAGKAADRGPHGATMAACVRCLRKGRQV